MIRLRQRREVDSEFDVKLKRFEMKWDPKITFFENLFGWVLALLFIYFIALR
jgi:hypothetical protein